MSDVSGPELAFSLRPFSVADGPFLRQLYREVREPELALMGWPPVQVQAFCNMQFDFRVASHSQYQPALTTSVVQVADVAVGRLDVVYGPRQWTLVNVELLAAWRGRGLGRQLLEGLQQRAAQAGVPVVLKVEVGSRAAVLYSRCGFEPVQSDGFLEQMEWRPAALSPSAAVVDFLNG